MFTSTVGAPISARTPSQPSASYQSIRVTPASPHIGAEIGDIDLTQPLSEQQQAEVKDAFTRYQVLFFRNQKISFEDQIRFASLFGPLGRHVGAQTISKPTDHGATHGAFTRAKNKSGTCCKWWCPITT